MTRYQTEVKNGVVAVYSDSDELEIGEVETILDIIGGPSWTIRYSDWEKQQYPDLDMSDEGLTIDIIDTIHAMTFDESFVKTLRAQPGETSDPDAISPRMGLFIGRLVENLTYGVR